MRSRARVALGSLTLIALAMACSGPDREVTYGVAPPPPPEFPALTKPGDVFLGSNAALKIAARYVLYADGTFAYQQPGNQQWPGSYTRADSVVALDFGVTAVGGPWKATAVIRGDTLSVSYNSGMQLNDFENASFVRAP